MKLHALQRQRFVTNAHDLTTIRLGCQLQHIRQRVVPGAERMITPNLQGLRQAFEDRRAVVFGQRRFTVHQAFCPDDVTTEMMHQTLVPQADTEYRRTLRKSGDHFERYAGVFRAAGTGRNYEMCCAHLQRCIDYCRLAFLD